jgi:hypothetical protein
MDITSHLQEKKYVAFLDVLGFKELVRTKGERLNLYFKTIENALVDIRFDKAEITSQLVSDSTILACDLTTDNLRLLLRAVQTIQARCAIENIWIRGAITIGDIHFDRELNIVVGNGLTDAYLLESQEKFPRVIIDPKILKVEFGFGTRRSFIKEYNEKEAGKKIPLIHQSYRESESIENEAIFVAFAERIILDNTDKLETVYRNIQKELYNSQNTYAKYFWLKQYFSEVLNRMANFNNTMERLNLQQTSRVAKEIGTYQTKFLNL